jgi:hypothetical protein
MLLRGTSRQSGYRLFYVSHSRLRAIQKASKNSSRTVKTDPARRQAYASHTPAPCSLCISPRAQKGARVGGSVCAGGWPRKTKATRRKIKLQCFMHSPVLKNYSLKSHFCCCGEWRRKRFCSSRLQNSYITHAERDVKAA